MHNQRKQLPKKILPIPCADKKFHEEWQMGDDELNFPHPVRILICGRPNTGKSTIIKNILLRQDPPFRKVYVVHPDKDYTEEYKDVNGIMLDSIPNQKDPIFGKKKVVIILEDLEFKFMNKYELRNLDRLFGYASTHKNASIIVSVQDCFNLPPAIRRMSNVWILGKIDNDKASFQDIARRCGLDKDLFLKIYNDHIKDVHDTVWIDATKNSKYPLRINGYKMMPMKMTTPESPEKTERKKKNLSTMYTTTQHDRTNKRTKAIKQTSTDHNGESSGGGQRYNSNRDRFFAVAGRPQGSAG